MLEADQSRLQREADIAKVVRGPDYRELEQSITKNKAAYQQAKYDQAQLDGLNKMFGMQAYYESLSLARKLILEDASIRRQITNRIHRMRSLSLDR